MSTTSGFRPSTPTPYLPQVPGFWALSCDEQTARRLLLEAAKVLSSKLDQCNKSGDFQPVHAAALSILARDAIALNQNVQPIKDLLQWRTTVLDLAEERARDFVRTKQLESVPQASETQDALDILVTNQRKVLHKRPRTLADGQPIEEHTRTVGNDSHPATDPDCLHKRPRTQVIQHPEEENIHILGNDSNTPTDSELLTSDGTDFGLVVKRALYLRATGATDSGDGTSFADKKDKALRGGGGNRNGKPVDYCFSHKGSELGVGEYSGGGTYLKKTADRQHIIDNFMDNVKTSIAQIRLHRERVIAQLNEHNLTLTPEMEAQISKIVAPSSQEVKLPNNSWDTSDFILLCEAFLCFNGIIVTSTDRITELNHQIQQAIRQEHRRRIESRLAKAGRGRAVWLPNRETRSRWSRSAAMPLPKGTPKKGT
ncbi:hypothetical protein HDU89_007746 [Geranomyces variabilis]|nr:hypothetical protein HDU89_007746 [Geranomyces variabilis]